jgi:ubiquitin-like-conjugating enzyme ATG3
MKPPTASRFFEEGTLTPQEFVAAGDQLVGASPSWSWKPAANEKLRNQHLPIEKQYLTTQAQCNKRIREDASVQKEVR